MPKEIDLGEILGMEEGKIYRKENGRGRYRVKNNQVQYRSYHTEKWTRCAIDINQLPEMKFKEYNVDEEAYTLTDNLFFMIFFWQLLRRQVATGGKE